MGKSEQGAAREWQQDEEEALEVARNCLER
jgi:hypothetical protein